MNNPYSTRKYNTKDRWLNYWYQIDSVLSFNPKTVLEIGTGSGIVYDALKKLGLSVKNIDIDISLNPDIIGSVDSLPFPDKSFDVALAAEILEHLPFFKFKKSLTEMRRAAKRGAIISLPHSGYTFSFSFKIPFLSWRHIIFKIPHFWKTKTSTPEHYWEIGMKNYSRKKIKKIIMSSGFIIEGNFIGYDDPSHIFFVLKC